MAYKKITDEKLSILLVDLFTRAFIPVPRDLEQDFESPVTLPDLQYLRLNVLKDQYGIRKVNRVLEKSRLLGLRSLISFGIIKNKRRIKKLLHEQGKKVVVGKDLVAKQPAMQSDNQIFHVPSRRSRRRAYRRMRMNRMNRTRRLSFLAEDHPHDPVFDQSVQSVRSYVSYAAPVRNPIPEGR